MMLVGGDKGIVSVLLCQDHAAKATRLVAPELAKQVLEVTNQSGALLRKLHMLISQKVLEYEKDVIKHRSELRSNPLVRENFDRLLLKEGGIAGLREALACFDELADWTKRPAGKGKKK
jgi:hypothetical protein